MLHPSGLLTSTANRPRPTVHHFRGPLEDRRTSRDYRNDFTTSTLSPGSTVTIELTTIAVGQTLVTFNVPDILDDESAISL